LSVIGDNLNALAIAVPELAQVSEQYEVEKVDLKPFLTVEKLK